MRTYTEEERLDHIKRQTESGLTIESYCKENSVNFHSFKNWRKRYVNNKINQDGDRHKTFVEVSAPRSESGIGKLKIYFPNGIHLSLDQELDSRLIKLLSDV